MKWLQTILETQGIEADSITSIIEEAKKQKLIPKERFDSVNSQLREANTTIVNVNTELETLKGKISNDEILKQQIADLQAANSQTVEQYESRIKEMKIYDHIKGEMSKQLKDLKYFDLLYKEVDHSKLAIGEDGTISGFDIKEFQDKYADLFETTPKGMGAFGNPPRKSPSPDQVPLGQRLAEGLKSTVTEKQNLYF